MRLDRLELIAERFEAAGSRRIQTEYKRHFSGDKNKDLWSGGFMFCMLSLKYIDSVFLIYLNSKGNGVTEALRLSLEVTDNQMFDLLSAIRSPFACKLIAKGIRAFIEKHQEV